MVNWGGLSPRDNFVVMHGRRRRVQWIRTSHTGKIQKRTLWSLFFQSGFWCMSHCRGIRMEISNWMTAVRISITHIISSVRKLACSNYKGLKSVNLQYNTLDRLEDGTNESSTKRLMFQVIFFFMISCRILCKNTFNLFVYFFKKIQK